MGILLILQCECFFMKLLKNGDLSSGWLSNANLWHHSRILVSLGTVHKPQGHFRWMLVGRSEPRYEFYLHVLAIAIAPNKGILR